MTSILDVLLDLSLLPARRRIAELRFVEIVAGQRHEADFDIAFLAATDLVDSCAHIVVDAALWHTAQNAEGMVVGVEQHLVRLQKVGPNDEGAAVAELRMGHLQLGTLVPDDRPVFRPVEREGFSNAVHQSGLWCTFQRFRHDDIGFDIL